MKKEKGTFSILESIKNKMQKIEKSGKNNDATNQNSDHHNDFQYIDSSSKEIIDSKRNPKTTNIQNQQIQSGSNVSSDDFDFLTDDKSSISTSIATSSVSDGKATIEDLLSTTNPISVNNDLDLELNKENSTDRATPKPVNTPDQNNLELGDLKVADLNKEKPLAPELTTNLSPTKPISELGIVKQEDKELKLEEDLNLDDLDLEENTDSAQQTSTPNSITNDVSDEIDDLDIEDLKEDQPKLSTNKTADILKPDALGTEGKISTKEDEKLKLEEDLNLDDDLDLKDDINLTISTPAPKNINTEIDDLNIEDLDLDENSSIKNTTTSPINSINNAPDQTVNNSNNDMTKDKNSIISPTIANNTANTIKELMQAIPKKQFLLNNPAPAFKSGETIEDMVAAMLEPKLEQWLNENLPALVEKVVRSEIKKILPQD